MNLRRTAGAAIAAVLGADCLLHLFWAATGSHWPAASATGLSRGLLNADVPFTPPVLLPLAAVLAAGAALVLRRAGLLGGPGRRIPAWMARLAVVALVAGASVRGLAGVAWALGLGADPGTPFYLLNLVAYTPACLALVAGGTVLLRRDRSPAVPSGRPGVPARPAA